MTTSSFDSGYECSYETAVQHLWDWQRGGTNFGAMIYSMIAKADHINAQRVALAFPQHFTVYRAWYDAEDPKEFFSRHGYPGFE